MADIFEATPDDPWWIDPTNTLAVLVAVREHCTFSRMCNHGRDNKFTYDFCPLANGIVTKAIANA